MAEAAAAFGRSNSRWREQQPSAGAEAAAGTTIGAAAAVALEAAAASALAAAATAAVHQIVKVATVGRSGTRALTLE
jgi:hypothetical protein